MGTPPPNPCNHPSIWYLAHFAIKEHENTGMFRIYPPTQDSSHHQNHHIFCSAIPKSQLKPSFATGILILGGWGGSKVCICDVSKLGWAHLSNWYETSQLKPGDSRICDRFEGDLPVTGGQENIRKERSSRFQKAIGLPRC